MKTKRMIGGINILATICLVMTMFITGCQTGSHGPIRHYAINSQVKGFVRVNDDPEWKRLPFELTLNMFRNRERSVRLYFRADDGRECERILVMEKDGTVAIQGAAVLGIVLGLVGAASFITDKITGSTLQIAGPGWMLMTEADFGIIPTPTVVVRCEHPDPKPAPKPPKNCAPIGSLEYAPSGKCPPPGAVPYDTTGINCLPRTATGTVTRYVQRVPVYEGPPVFSMGPIKTTTHGPDGMLHQSSIGPIRYGPEKPSTAGCKPTQKKARLTGPLDVSGK